MTRRPDMLIASMLLFSIGLLSVFGFLNWNSGQAEQRPADDQGPAVTFGAPSPLAEASSTPEISPTATPETAVTYFPAESGPDFIAPQFFSQPGESPLVAPSAGDVDCRLWNVLRPVDTSLESFWIGGWVEECDGVIGPVIKLGPGESIEEVYLRLENAIAQIRHLEQQLQAANEAAESEQ